MDYALARLNMVRNQVHPAGVSDPAVLEAMAEIPREEFLNKDLRGIAYLDDDIPLPGGRSLMEPLVTGRLLQAAEIRPADVVLDVGCATGYAAAVLARLASAVVALESDPTLARGAAETLSRLGIDTAAVVEGPLEKGFPKQAPFDVVFINGAVAEVPKALCEQLADGGRLVAVVESGRVGNGVLIRRDGNLFPRRELFEARTAFLPGFEARPAFEF